uniref:LysO family transporter n=1 Tax=uncultured Draconibacterium sp. TaxID=1573823 RepID=UPI0032166F6C
MVTVLVLMTIGIFLGRYLGRIPKLMKVVEKLISYAIFLLLFLLGISVGVNKTIIDNLDNIGMKALAITVGTIAGSVIVLWILYKTMFSADVKEGRYEE